jgi:hypothetical protein
LRDRALLDQAPEARRREPEPPVDHALLALQRGAGNQAVARHLARRRTLSRLQGPDGAQELEQAIWSASVPELKIILEDLERQRAAVEDGVTVRLPLQSVSIRGEDVARLRFKVVEKLHQASMFMLASGRQKLFLQMQAAANETDRRTRTVELRAFDAPYLADIRRYAKSPAQRFQHDDPTVVDGVLAAVQLEAVANAEGFLAAPKDAHEKAAKAAGMDLSFDWCGFFAMDNYMVSNLDADLRRGFFHVTNVEHYFTYTYAFGPVKDTRVMKWIYAEDEWHDLREYHTQRGSVRTWMTGAQIDAGGTLDIRAGDIVLLDHQGSTAADHIVMVQSYDPATNILHTIGGNDGGYKVDNAKDRKAPKGEAQAEREKRERLEASTGQPLKKDSSANVGVSEYDLDDQPAPKTVKEFVEKPVRVYGIGRPSLVDMEEHRYDSTDPKHPPNAAAKK